MHLQITNASVNDQDLYSCIATSSIGMTSKNITLNVLAAPFLNPNLNITNGQNNLIIPYGETETLKCPIIGFPTPQVNWIEASVNANKTLLEKSEIQINTSSLVGFNRIVCITKCLPNDVHFKPGFGSCVKRIISHMHGKQFTRKSQLHI